MGKLSLIKTSAHSALASVLAFVIVSTYSGSAQAQDHHAGGTRGPLVLKEQGMFFVGGDIVQTDWAHAPNGFFASFPRSGDIAINQMYVAFMVPQAQRGVPIILMHGGTLSGACYETTPDGRMGWYEYFARKGHAVYLPDQVSRARSGFDVTPFNEVAAGVRPPSALPNVVVLTKAFAWQAFRFGPSLGTAFPDGAVPGRRDRRAREAIDSGSERRRTTATRHQSHPDPPRGVGCENRRRGPCGSLGIGLLS